MLAFSPRLAMHWVAALLLCSSSTAAPFPTPTGQVLLVDRSWHLQLLLMALCEERAGWRRAGEAALQDRFFSFGLAVPPAYASIASACGELGEPFPDPQAHLSCSSVIKRNSFKYPGSGDAGQSEFSAGTLT